MKQSEIKAGVTYGNITLLRTVNSIGQLTPRVAYTEYGDNEPTNESCWLSSFARWAQFRVDPGTTVEQLVEMQVKSLRLSQDQQAFLMSNAFGETKEPDFKREPMTVFYFEHHNARLVAQLKGKGAITYDKDQRIVELTPLGFAWVKSQQKERE